MSAETLGTIAGVVSILIIGAGALSVVCALALSGRISRGRGE